MRYGEEGAGSKDRYPIMSEKVGKVYETLNKVGEIVVAPIVVLVFFGCLLVRFVDYCEKIYKKATQKERA